MRPLYWGVAVVVLLGLAGLAAYLWPGKPPAPPPPVASAPQTPKEAEGPRHPIPAPEAALPKLGESDATAVEALAALLGMPAVQKLFFAEDLVRRIVATVDNLPREMYAQRLSPLIPVPGAFTVQGKEGERAIAPANARRYEAHVRALEGLDIAQTAAAYRRLYPLFQQAYEELGYPKGYFNDRLVEVIDHLMEAPEAPPPVRVAAPKALYEYVDPDQESLSAGHKVLVRMGPEHARRVKSRLEAIRRELVSTPARPRER